LSLPRGGSILFPCDPSMEPVRPSIDGEEMTISGADLLISMKFAVRIIGFDWHRTYKSQLFHCINSNSRLVCTDSEAAQADLP
jgi:hypothetical protein